MHDNAPARIVRYLGSVTDTPVTDEVRKFFASGRSSCLHFGFDPAGDAIAILEVEERERANMEQALRTEITIELGHKPDAKAGPFAGHKPPVVHIECVHEGIADDDAHAALWHDEAVTAATQAAAALMQRIGLADPEPPRGTVFVSVKGDAAGLMRAITDAERVQSLADLEARHRHAAGETAQPKRPYAGDPDSIDIPPARPFAGDPDRIDAPRYQDDELESIAVEVMCAAFGDAYRAWLDSDDEYGIAARERGAGAIRSSMLYREAKS